MGGSDHIGVIVGADMLPHDEAAEQVRIAEKLGAGSIWLPQMPGQRDTLTALGPLLAATDRIRIGTAITPIYTRPPVTMAQMAATLDEYSGGRLVLGLGYGQRMINEWMLGAAVGPPEPAMREYLSIVRGLLHNGEADVTGRWFSAHTTYTPPRRAHLPIYVGALGPRMLRLAGEVADGVIIWLSSPSHLRERLMPHIDAGLAKAGRPSGSIPVVVSLPTIATDDLAVGRARFRAYLAGVIRMPVYRRAIVDHGFAVESNDVSDAMIDAFGAIGGPARLRARVDEYRAAGATVVAIGPLLTGGTDRSFSEAVRAVLS